MAVLVIRRKHTCRHSHHRVISIAQDDGLEHMRWPYPPGKDDEHAAPPDVGALRGAGRHYRPMRACRGGGRPAISATILAMIALPEASKFSAAIANAPGP